MNIGNVIVKAVVSSCVILLLFSIAAGAEDEIRVIVRGDDLGMTYGSLVAFEQAFNRGILTSGAIIVSAPWFEGAAELSRKNPGWCVGVHMALVGEWRGYRWRPVLPYDQVPSLVDEDGFLFQDPESLEANNPDLGEMEAELRAQLALALKKGVNVGYLDFHYGGVDHDIVAKIAAEHDLPVSGTFDEQRISIYSVPSEEKKAQAIKMFEELEPGLYLWVSHPGIDSPEQRALIHSDPAAVFTEGGVGVHRAAVLDAQCSLELKSIVMQRGIKLISYTDLWNEQKK
ncbi:ChbG/HpnK family deacetylase [Candidatus Latescibacterota bacterium]